MAEPVTLTVIRIFWTGIFRLNLYCGFCWSFYRSFNGGLGYFCFWLILFRWWFFTWRLLLNLNCGCLLGGFLYRWSLDRHYRRKTTLNDRMWIASSSVYTMLKLLNTGKTRRGSRRGLMWWPMPEMPEENMNQQPICRLIMESEIWTWWSAKTQLKYI